MAGLPGHPMGQAAMGQPLVLEFHIFIDPLDASASSSSHLARCRAAAVALSGRLAPRLRRAAWNCEPFALVLWDPSEPASRRGSEWAKSDSSSSLGRIGAEAHVWGQASVGESLDDEWFIVGLLLQLSVEQPDLSIAVADGDGELLLIEAAYAIPRWVTPERAPNRVFLRGGHVHIVPRGSGGNGDEALPIAEALRALRTGSLGSTRRASATDAVRVRTDPLMGEDASTRGPPSHGARCVLPLPVARMLSLEPRLAAAAAAAFAERDGTSMRAASRMPNFSPRLHDSAEVHVVFARCGYAQLAAARFEPPEAIGFKIPPLSHSKHKANVNGARIALGMELLLLRARSSNGTDSNGGDGERGVSSGEAVLTAGGAAWEAFEEELHARGYYRGELPSSELHATLRRQAASAYAAPPPKLPQTTWIVRQAERARRLLSGEGKVRLDAVELPDASKLPPVESDAWLGLDEKELEEKLKQHEQPGGKSASKDDEAAKQAAKEAAKEAAQAQKLKQMAASMSEFIDGGGSHEGAELSGQDGVQLDPERFMAALKEMVGGEIGKKDGEKKDGETSDYDDDSNEDEDDEFYGEYGDDSDGEDGEEEGEEGEETMKDIMAAMDAELREKQVGADFELEPNTKAAAGGAKPSGTKHDGSSEAGANPDDDPARPVDLDLNLVKNLMESYSSQAGLSGPVSNLLGSLGITLPDDKDGSASGGGVVV